MSQRHKRQQLRKIQFNELQEYTSFQMNQDNNDHHEQQRPKRAPQLSQAQVQQRQKLYMKSKFQFVMYEYKEVRWDDVLQVIYATTHEITCPICMNDFYEIIIPYITSCGHVYCLPCFHRHRNLSKFNQKCPLCGELVMLSDLKSVKLLKQKLPSIGEVVNLNKLTKYRKDNEIYLNNKESQLYARTLVVNQAYVSNFLEQEIEQLSNLLEYCDQEISQSIQQSIEFLIQKQDKISKKNQNEQSNIFLRDMLIKDDIQQSFYQDSTGLLGFLHPLCNKYLTQQYGNETLQSIQAKLIQMDKFIQSEHTLRRYKFLSHIPLYTELYFYEIDLQQLLSQENYEKYQYELQEYRNRQLKEKQKSEEQYNQLQLKLQQNEQKQQQMDYNYFVPIQDDFEYNEQDFPELPKQQQQEPIEQQSQQQQLLEQNPHTIIEQKQKSQQKKSDSLDSEYFPPLNEESSQVIYNPFSETWGKQQQQQQQIIEKPIIQQQQEVVKLSDLDFQIIVKKKNKKGKQI